MIQVQVEHGENISHDLSFQNPDVRRLSSDPGQPWWSPLVRCSIFQVHLLATDDFTRKIPWRLSHTRKANARARLKKVDAVIEAVRASGVQCNALVCHLLFHYGLR